MGGEYYNSVYYTKLDPSLDTQDGDAADPSVITLIDDKAVSGYYDNYSVKRIGSAVGCGKYIHLSWWERYTEDLYYMVLDTDGNPVVMETALTTTGSVTTSKGGSEVHGWMVPYLDVDSNGKAHIMWVDDRDNPDPADPDEEPDFVEVYYTSYEGPPCEAQAPSAPVGVPALTQWGAIGLMIALAGCIVWTLRRRKVSLNAP